MENGLVHRVGDVAMLAQQIAMLHEDRTLLGRLRAGCLRTAREFTWTAAGVRLLQVYREAISLYREREARPDFLPDSAARIATR
jgi:hypothetical protein